MGWEDDPASICWQKCADEVTVGAACFPSQAAQWNLEKTDSVRHSMCFKGRRARGALEVVMEQKEGGV